MNLDLMVLGLLALFALLGAAAGGVIQLSHIGAITVGGLVARPVGTAFGAQAAVAAKVPAVVGVLGLTVVTFIVVYAAVQVLCRMALKRILRNPALGALDRAAGFVLGAGKTAMILFVLLSAFLFFEKPIASFSPTLRFDTRGSRVADFVRAHNLFTSFSFPGVQGLAALARASTDPAAAAQLAKSPQIAALLKSSQIKAVLGDSGLQRSLQNGDFISALRNTKVMDALTNPALQGQLSALNEGTLRAALDGTGKN